MVNHLTAPFTAVSNSFNTQNHLYICFGEGESVTAEPRPGGKASLEEITERIKRLNAARNLDQQHVSHRDLSDIENGFMAIIKGYEVKRSGGCFGVFRNIFYAIFRRYTRPEKLARDQLAILQLWRRSRMAMDNGSGLGLPPARPLAFPAMPPVRPLEARAHVAPSPEGLILIDRAGYAALAVPPQGALAGRMATPASRGLELRPKHNVRAERPAAAPAAAGPREADVKMRDSNLTAMEFLQSRSEFITGLNGHIYANASDAHVFVMGARESEFVIYPSSSLPGTFKLLMKGSRSDIAVCTITREKFEEQVATADKR